MLKAINPSITPAAAGKVAPSNVIAFPGGRAAAPCLPAARATPHDIERSIARVAAIPAPELLGKVELAVLMARLAPNSSHAPCVLFEAMLCLCRVVDAAGFPVPAMEVRS
jgi:hypothetical protein